MFLKTLRMFLILVVFSYWGMAQDCTLNMGGKSADTLVQVFQLNEQQISQMEVWSVELAIEIKVVEGEIQKLFDSHPQSTPEELSSLAAKYKVLQQKIVAASKATDQRLLSTFNTKQYDLYLELCKEAFRKPLQVIPVTVQETEDNPE